MKRTAMVVLALALVAPAAQAEIGLGVHLMLGFRAEGEADELKCKKGCQGSLDPGSEDLEGNLGAQVTYERPMSDSFRLGGRAAFMTAEGDDTEQELKTYDLGVWARFVFPAGAVSLYLAGAAGPTYVTTELELPTVGDTEFSGIGYHVVLGGGLTTPINESLTFLAGLFYGYQAATMEGDKSVQGTKVEVEVEDAVLTRFLLIAGLQF